MALASKEQLLAAIKQFREELPVSIRNRTELYMDVTSHDFSFTFLLPNGRTTIYVSCLGNGVTSPATLLYNNSEKYYQVTGCTAHDSHQDFLYHWITGFASLNSFQAIKAAVKDPATCGSFATTVAVNAHMQTVREEYKEKEFRELVKGSKWRWIKTAQGEYVQQTLFSVDSDGDIDNCGENDENDLFPSANLRSLVSFREHFLAYVAQVDREHTGRPRELESYTTRATSRFKFKKGDVPAYNTFLGVELELEYHSQQEWPVLDSLKDHAIFKRDGSLSRGVEICTAPATLDVHKKEFSKFFTAMKEKKSKLKAESTCGLHVHVDKSKLSKLHIASLYLFVNNKDNRRNIETIAGRSANNYCKVHETGYSHFTSNGENDRYRQVNLSPERTIEFRLFASTTNEQDFNKRLEFTQAVVDYTRPGEVDIPVTKVPLWENFVNYVKKHTNIYPVLSKSFS